MAEPKVAYADKAVAYLHMAALVGNAADKLMEYANNPIVVELALIDSNAGTFRALADTVRQEARQWEAIHAAIATMQRDRPFVGEIPA
ncbi:hypothetical protein LCGC14_1106000 [marine sediment metagenome]|uniref:Uncharacterized protein n=1 Tax=marine sediment metagenome TaxID=412755 RepID=A0A0F9MW21_9ZZZZ